MATSGANGSMVARAYASLREQIVLGRFVPGQRLGLAELGKEAGVSFNVIREALNRLAGEGLVSATPQQGFAVARMSRQELSDLLDVRIEVETLGIRWAVKRGDIEWQSKLVGAFHRLSRTPARNSDSDAISAEWQQAHLLFHTAMFEGSGNERLTTLGRALADEYALYRGWVLSLLPHDRLGDEDHAAMMNAALDGDAERAASLLTEHYRRSAEVFLVAVENTPS